MLKEGDEIDYWIAILNFEIVEHPEWLFGYGAYVTKMMLKHPGGGMW